MPGFVVRRLGHALLGVFLVVLVTFLLIHAAPGDPFTASGREASLSAEQLATLRSHYGLDRPLHVQFIEYVFNVARGDLGNSTLQPRPVLQAIAAALPNTLLLMGAALLVSIIAGVALGVLQAHMHGRAGDRVLSGATLFFHSMPDFWLATMVLLLLSYWFPIFPSGGTVNIATYPYLSGLAKFGDRIAHLALPVLTLALLTTAFVARHQRSAMLDELHNDYVRVAAAKGASRLAVLGHALRNALLPVISILGLALPSLVGGAVFVESVFAWPGMGLLAYQAIGARDYALILGIVIIASLMVSLGNLLADLLCAAADPRIESIERS